MTIVSIKFGILGISFQAAINSCGTCFNFGGKAPSTTTWNQGLRATIRFKVVKVRGSFATKSGSGVGTGMEGQVGNAIETDSRGNAVILLSFPGTWKRLMLTRWRF